MISDELYLAAQVQSILQEYEHAWSFDTRDLERPRAEQLLRQLVERSEPQWRTRLEAEFFGNGPLGPLLEDASVQEIVVNGASEIFFEKEGRHAATAQ